ncbi:cytochrome c oxidase assembly protein [Piscinibacter koreensis]|uniref:Cytochrome c oxidase assembly protein CtaG n=1 Tax=Piscinibacter koreensis TaxID=2742824 RepID=A0A7Y6TXD3_9BURK|nr:cytochrome c oxidase assembly protein [Schlegelella koreensis]NUZ07038.1 cytochrome c oxidase assembly protein [Schlegelella koreensis]
MTRPDPAARADSILRSDNRRIFTKLVVITVLMFGFGYALVPIYRAVCNALGINVLSVAEITKFGSRQPVNGQVDATRTVTIEFDANARGPWEFKPAQRTLDVHPGELATVIYEFRNPQDRTMVAQAIPSYAPLQAGSHFNKLECFCFSEHTLKPGESRQWPVTFVVDNKLPRDVRTITLSYTFFEVGGKVPPAPDQAARTNVPAPAGAPS